MEQKNIEMSNPKLISKKVWDKPDFFLIDSDDVNTINNKESMSRHENSYVRRDAEYFFYLVFDVDVKNGNRGPRRPSQMRANNFAVS